MNTYQTNWVHFIKAYSPLKLLNLCWIRGFIMKMQGIFEIFFTIGYLDRQIGCIVKWAWMPIPFMKVVAHWSDRPSGLSVYWISHIVNFCLKKIFTTTVLYIQQIYYFLYSNDKRGDIHQSCEMMVERPKWGL